jgi:hypothetical protein
MAHGGQRQSSRRRTVAEPNAWQAVGGTIWTSEDNRPLKPEWQGLTDEEIDEIYAGEGGTRTRRRIVRLIEAKLKEKNT